MREWLAAGVVVECTVRRHEQRWRGGGDEAAAAARWADAAMTSIPQLPLLQRHPVTTTLDTARTTRQCEKCAPAQPS